LGGTVILVEGLFDLASLWQAGFVNTVAALGLYLNQQQWIQLPEAHRIYLCFDSDGNGSGQRAAAELSGCLRHAGREALCVALPAGHDPNSFFAAGAEAADFQRCLDQARP
jgi:DNA primase